MLTFPLSQQPASVIVLYSKMAVLLTASICLQPLWPEYSPSHAGPWWYNQESVLLDLSLKVLHCCDLNLWKFAIEGKNVHSISDIFHHWKGFLTVRVINSYSYLLRLILPLLIKALVPNSIQFQNNYKINTDILWKFSHIYSEVVHIENY